MKFNLLTVFKNSIALSRKQYNRYYKIVNGVCAMPFFILKKIEVYDISISMIVFLAIIYALAVGVKIVYREEESLKSVLLTCTVRAHIISALFWVILGGLASVWINKINENRQETIDRTEYELAYHQFQQVVLQDVIEVSDDCINFRYGYKYYENSDYAKAAAYLKVAADKDGCAYAAHLFAELYYYGLGVSCDKYLALKYYAMAAEKEVVEAKYRLMMHYFCEDDNEAAESYGVDILEKSHFGVPTINQIMLSRSIGNSDILELIKPITDVIQNLVNIYTMTYNVIYAYHFRAQRYNQAAYFAESFNESFMSGRSVENDCNIAICKLMDGDKLGAKRHFKKILRSKKYGDTSIQFAEEQYVRHILIPAGGPWRYRNVKEAEKILIENVKLGSETSMSLLKEIYRRAGYQKSFSKIDHYESYYKLLNSHEGK